MTEAHDAFERRLSGVEATVKIEDTAEQDEFDSSDWYAFHGGFVSAVTRDFRRGADSYVGDSSDPDNVEMSTNEEKVRKAMRARVLNPDWLDSMEEHGYKGAGDLSTTVDVTLGWDATTDVISDTLWENVAERTPETRSDRTTPRREPRGAGFVHRHATRAIERGLWDADDETRDRLRDLNRK